GDTLHVGLTAELAFGTYFTGDAGHFRSEGAKLIDHRVDRVLELQDFAPHIDRDLFRQVARSHGFRHVGDVTHSRRQVARHRVPRVSQRSPDLGDTLHVGLTAQLAFGAYFAGHAGYFGRERAELIDHRINGVFQLQNFALHIDRDLARQIAISHG